MHENNIFRKPLSFILTAIWWIIIFIYVIKYFLQGRMIMKMILIIFVFILALLYFFAYAYADGTQCTIVEYQKGDRIIAIFPNLHMGSERWFKKFFNYLNSNDLIIMENIIYNDDLWNILEACGWKKIKSIKTFPFVR